MPQRRLPLALALAAVSALAPAAAAATPRDSYESHRLRVTGPVAGLAGKTHETTATLVAPADWRRVGKASRTRLRLRAPGTELCTWTFTFTTRVFVGANRPAAEVVAGRAPGESEYELDRGTRGGGAWRVVRLVADTVLVGSRIDPVSGTAPRGQRLWREITARAEPGAEDECHMGTYSDFAGPKMGDVLAVAKGRASV
jgi:hypothetical protein